MALAFAYDYATSVRRIDADGRLHVSTAVLTSACVSRYVGAEIPEWRRYGLSETQVYRVFRPPEEIRKAVGTFNSLPVLSKHVPINAVQHRGDLVIGATGSDARFDGSDLENSLVIWVAGAIERVLNGSCDGISSGYSYVGVPESGSFEGAPYDLRMSRIAANHVALVSDPRVPNAVIGDAAFVPRRRCVDRAARLGSFWF